MILDEKMIFHNNNNAFADNNTVCDNYMDLQSADADWGKGRPLRAKAVVTTNFNQAANANATVTAAIQDSEDASNWNNVVSGKTYAYNAAVVGTELLNTPLPADTRRYIRVAFVCANNMTAGKGSSFLTL